MLRSRSVVFYYYLESMSILNKNFHGNTFGPMKSIVFEFSYSYNQGLDYKSNYTIYLNKHFFQLGISLDMGPPRMLPTPKPIQPLGCALVGVPLTWAHLLPSSPDG